MGGKKNRRKLFDRCLLATAVLLAHPVPPHPAGHVRRLPPPLTSGRQTPKSGATVDFIGQNRLRESGPDDGGNGRAHSCAPRAGLTWRGDRLTGRRRPPPPAVEELAVTCAMWGAGPFVGYHIPLPCGQRWDRTSCHVSFGSGIVDPGFTVNWLGRNFRVGGME